MSGAIPPEPIDLGKAGGDPSVRTDRWEAAGLAELELAVDVGRITVALGTEPEVRVEVRYDPSVGGPWTQGLTGVISWIGQATGGQTVSPEELAVDAVRAVQISWSPAGRRLVVRSSQEIPLRIVPLAVTVHAPVGSRLAARTGAGDVDVTGTAGWAAVRTGAGQVVVAGVDGDADVTTGSGDLTVGDVTGRVRLRTGSGAIRLASAGGATDIQAGSGNVEIGSVTGDLVARTGSGGLRIIDARAGHVDVTTGSGRLYVGVHPGVAAELDLTSGSGRPSSELDVAFAPPREAVGLHVRGRTGSGDVLVARALVPA